MLFIIMVCLIVGATVHCFHLSLGGETSFYHA
jgi:hypothetical protein